LVELGAPFLLVAGRAGRRAAGLLFVVFQLTLIASGNLSFLNWLTIVPAIACFDDGVLRPLVPRALWARAATSAPPSRSHRAMAIALAALVVVLSVDPVLNLLSPQQAMNRSFDRLHLVNTYGAFGSVGRERYEIIFEGTSSSTPEFAAWREYEFPAKPGDPFRRPPIIAPYQPRLDWQIWFAAMASWREYPWTIHFTWKLLHNDPGTLSLLANNPFPDGPPRYVRAELYR